MILTIWTLWTTFFWNDNNFAALASQFCGARLNVACRGSIETDTICARIEFFGLFMQ